MIDCNWYCRFIRHLFYVFSILATREPPLTNAEKQRKYREKLKTTGKYEAYIEKEHKRYIKRKMEGKLVYVHDLPEKEKCALRRKWRLTKRASRLRNVARGGLATDRRTRSNGRKKTDSDKCQ